MMSFGETGDASKQLALVGSRARDPDSSDYSSDEEDDYKGPPGPLSPFNCTVGGSGFTGGCAGAPVSLYVHAKDERGRRISEGGAEVEVRIAPAGSVPSSAPIDAIVEDKSDGTYIATFTIPSRGNYVIHVEVEGIPIQGSPFPVYFSAPIDPNQAANAAGQAGNTGASGSGMLGSPSQPALRQSGSEPPANSIAGAMMAGANMALASIGGLAGDAMLRTLYVSNISPQVTLAQLTQLFGYCGKVSSFKLVGDGRDLAVLEFETVQEAKAAQGLDKMVVGDRPLKVQPPTMAGPSLLPNASNPYMALQIQQMQSVQAAVLQSQQLAAQVAQMRAVSRTGILPTDTDRLRAVEEEIKKKYSSSDKTGRFDRSNSRRDRSLDRDHSRYESSRRRSRSRGRSPSRVKGRSRSRSRSRRRSYSRSRRSLSRSRRPSPPRIRRPSPVRPRRSRSRGRRYSRSPSTRPANGRVRSISRGTRRSNSRGRKRSRSRSPKRAGGPDAGMSKPADKARKRTRSPSRDRSRRDKGREGNRDDKSRDDRNNRRQLDARDREGSRDEKECDSKRRDSRREESKRDERRNDYARKDDGKRNDSKREDSRKEDSKREDSRREDSKREDRKREDSKREDSKREDSRRQDSKRDDSKRDVSKREDGKRGDYRKDVINKDDRRREERRKHDDRKEDSRREDSTRKESSRKEGKEPKQRDGKEQAGRQEHKQHDSKIEEEKAHGQQQVEKEEKGHDQQHVEKDVASKKDDEEPIGKAGDVIKKQDGAQSSELNGKETDGITRMDDHGEGERECREGSRGGEESNETGEGRDGATGMDGQGEKQVDRRDTPDREGDVVAEGQTKIDNKDENRQLDEELQVADGGAHQDQNGNQNLVVEEVNPGQGLVDIAAET